MRPASRGPDRGPRRARPPLGRSQRPRRGAHHRHRRRRNRDPSAPGGRSPGGPETGQRYRFRSAIVPPWCRKSPKVAEVLPLMYLYGMSTGGFSPALTEFFGNGAGLSASVITRLTKQWHAAANVWRSEWGRMSSPAWLAVGRSWVRGSRSTASGQHALDERFDGALGGPCCVRQHASGGEEGSRWSAAPNSSAFSPDRFVACSPPGPGRYEAGEVAYPWSRDGLGRE